MKRWTRFLTLALCILSILTLTGCGGLRGWKASQNVAVLFPDSSEIWRRSGSSLQDSLKKVGFDYANDRPLGAVLSPNDNLAGGIREALNLHYKGTWPFITGLDADPEGIRALADDRQGMTIDKPPALPVKECLRLVQEIATGQSVPTTNKVNNGMRDVPAFLCKPSVIYKSNLKSVHKEQ